MKRIRSLLLPLFALYGVLLAGCGVEERRLPRRRTRIRFTLPKQI